MFPGYGLLTLAFTIANFVWWRGRYTRTGVVRKYGTWLARTLEIRSGAGPFYRSTDVTRALFASHLSIAFSSYAYAMFCDAAEFAKSPYCAQLNYDTLRREIVDVAHGPPSFRPQPA
jgi:hypothetical protein